MRGAESLDPPLESHRSRARLLASVPGLGHVSIAGLLALLPELGGLDGKAVASLAGLAPFARDSGLMKGRRTIWGGRAPVRTGLSWQPWSPPATPQDQSLLPAPRRRRKTQEARAHRRHAQAPRHPQRHAQEQHPVDAGSDSLTRQDSR